MRNKTSVPRKPQPKEKNQKECQEMLAACEKVWRAWEENRNAILRKRDDLLKSKLEVEQQRLRDRTEEEFGRKREMLQRALDDCIARKTSAKARCAALGFFAFDEKRSAKKVIHALARQIDDLKRNQKANDASYREQQERDQDALSEFCISQKMNIAQQYPIPDMPAKPFHLFRNIEQMIAQQRENLTIQYAMLEFMEAGRLYAVAEIIDDCPACADQTKQCISTLLIRMCEEGKIERVEGKRKEYFIRTAQLPNEPVQAVKLGVSDMVSSLEEAALSVIQQVILEFVGTGCTIADIIDGCPVCAELTEQCLSALLHRMCEEGKLKRFEDKEGATVFKRIVQVVHGVPSLAINLGASDMASSPKETGIKGTILDLMVPGNFYTVTDIVLLCYVYPDLTNQRVAAILSMMCDEGKLERIKAKRRVYFGRID